MVNVGQLEYQTTKWRHVQARNWLQLRYPERFPLRHVCTSDFKKCCNPCTLVYAANHIQRSTTIPNHRAMYRSGHIGPASSFPNNIPTVAHPAMFWPCVLALHIRMVLLFAASPDPLHHESFCLQENFDRLSSEMRQASQGCESTQVASIGVP